MLTYLLLFSWLLPFSYSFQETSKYISFLPCDETIIKAIEKYWKKEGKPQSPLKTISGSTIYVDLYTSYFPQENFDCIYFEFSDSSFTVTMHERDGSTTIVNEYTAEEDGNGVIRGRPKTRLDDPKLNYVWYPIDCRSDVCAVYGCGFDKESTQPPLGNIFVSESSYYYKTTQDTVNKLHEFMMKSVTNFTAQFGKECFLTK